MTVHQQPHPGAGKTFLVVSVDPYLNGSTVRIEDYWDRVMGREFWTSAFHPMGPRYMFRQTKAGFPRDEEIVYGKDPGGLGQMVHVSELGAEAS